MLTHAGHVSQHCTVTRTVRNTPPFQSTVDRLMTETETDVPSPQSESEYGWQWDPCVNVCQAETIRLTLAWY